MKFLDKTELKLFLSIALVYFFFIHWIGWNENSRLNLTMAIVDKGTLQIDDYYNNTGDRAFFNGHYYSDKAPGLAFFTVPIYAFVKSITPDINLNGTTVHDPVDPAGGLIIDVNPGPRMFLTMILSTFIASSILAALTAVLIFRILKYFTPDQKLRLLVPIIYSFGTLAFPLALVFYSHTASTFFIFLSFYILFWMNQEKKLKLKFAAIAGLSAGIAFLIEYTTFPFSIGILLVILTFKNKTFRNKSILIFVTSFIVAIIPLFFYNYLIFGNPLEFGYFHLDLKQFDVGFINKNFGKNFTVDTVLNASKTEMLINFNLNPASLLYHLNVIIRVLFYPYRGLLFYYPILILSLLGLLQMYKTRRLLFITITLPFLLTLWLVSMPYFHWWGGAIFGPRQLLPIIPFLMIPLASLRKIPLNLVIMLFLVSLTINILGLQPPENTLSEKFVVMNDGYLKMVNSIYSFGNPIVGYYWPKFLEEGPQSKILNGLIYHFPNIDIRNFAFDYDYKKIFTIDSIGIVVLNTKYIAFLLIFPLLLIWSKELSKLIGRFNLIILFMLLMISLILYSIGIKQITYDDNWYKEPADAPRWQSQNGTITYFSPKERIAVLNISMGVYNRTKTVELYLNNKFVDSYLISSGDEFILDVFELKKGENIFRFNSKEGCEFPDKDLKCFSFFTNVKEVNIDELNVNESMLTRLKDFYTVDGAKKDTPDKFTILIGSLNDTKARLRFNVKSYYHPRDLTIVVRNDTLNNYTILTSVRNVITSEFSIMRGKNRIEFSSGTPCNIPHEIENTSDFRCLAFEVTNIELIPSEFRAEQFDILAKSNETLSKNWYPVEKTDEGHIVWMSQNGTIELSNDETKLKSAYLNVNVSSYHRPRNVIVFNNDKIVDYIKVETANYTAFKIPVPLQPGLNQLKFHSIENCDIPSEIEKNDDNRCLSLVFNKIILAK